MNVEQEQSRSVWMDLPAIELPPLAGDAAADVLVIGAGIAGLSTAYELARAGRAVTVVDRGNFGRGMTARTSAHLAFELDDFFEELTKLRGLDASRQYYASQSAAVDRIEEISREEGIDCDFARVDGLFVPAEDKDVDYLRKELRAAREAGFADAEWLESGGPGWLATPAIRYPRQGRFHPLKYVNGLIEALGRLGVERWAMTPIMELEETDHGVRAKAENGAVVTAGAVVVATNSPFHLRIPIHTKQAPYRTYVIAGPVPKGSAPDALIWDTLEPAYHYVRLQPGETEDTLIVGGEDHKSGEADDMGERVDRLEAWARERYPSLGKITHAWSGQVYEPADYVPFIGRSPEHERVFVITGDSGEGLTTGVAGALVLRDLVNGRDSPWSELYEPSRLMTRGFTEFLKENVDATRHWIAHLGGGDIGSLEDLKPGEGALLKIDGKMTAAYRCPDGELHLRDATCTHAGCVVRWNSFETCWDCPCHGSQFSIDGTPLQAPAVRSLARRQAE